MRILDEKLLYKNISDRQRHLLETGRVGRCEILVRQDGKTVFHESFGCKTNLMYRLASMTKPVTAAAVLSEVQKGRLSLEDKVSRFFDGFADQYVGALDENGSVIPKEKVRNEITIRMLLNHTSGILSDIGGVGEAQERAMKPEDRENLTTVTNYINHILLSFQPGETAFYSATGAFDVAARIVELTSGMPFSEYIDQFIMRPLGISDITFVPSEEQWGRMSQMHYFDGQKVWYEDTGRTIFEGFPLTYFCGGAGLAGTAEAYSVFAEMLLNEGSLRSGAVLEPESVRHMKTPYIPISGDRNDAQWWGLGVRVIANDRYTLPKGCFGWSGAYGSHFWVDPENRVTAVYMKNSRFDGGSGAQSSAWFEEDVAHSFR